MFLFFFKQKTAYDMRISDWSSDVCSSDLTELDGDKPLIANAFFKRKLAELEVDLTALEFTELRSLAGANAGKGPGPESSLLKIQGSEIQQRLTELTLEAVGHYGAHYFCGFGEGDNEHTIGPDSAHRAEIGRAHV